MENVIQLQLKETAKAMMMRYQDAACTDNAVESTTYKMFFYSLIFIYRYSMYVEGSRIDTHFYAIQLLVSSALAVCACSLATRLFVCPGIASAY